ncbi:tetratricopeptide repeat protein [Aquabacterium sp. A08]|uniref:tetratricopeptide repeat protein n=1 Tax=Aquabacterium sp. A08 TaxID=2718532 RepID=UPI00141FACD6|nr:tetratricopeptide repeat protein [Aquabacterium sp. A08]NIC42161.1 tetratricopeptide repeat protein [Aquabacterium sp. A08]
MNRDPSTRATTSAHAPVGLRPGGTAWPTRAAGAGRPFTVLLLGGLLAAALGTLPRAAQADATPPNPEPVASDLDAALFYQLLLGEIQLRQNDPGAAFSLVLDAANRTRRAELYRRAVDIALQSRAGQAALNATRDWAQAHPTSEEPHRFELQILLALNRPGDTAAPLRQLIRLAPPERRHEVIAAIPQTLARATDTAAALAAVQDALRPALADPATAVAAWVTIGRLQLQAQRPQEALASARQALSRQPHAPTAAALVLELLEREQAGALPTFQRFLQTPPAATGHARLPLHLTYVRILIDQRRWAEAAAELQGLQQTAAQSPEVWLLQGTLDLQQRRPEAAETALRRHLDLASQAPEGDPRQGQIQALLLLAQIAEQRQDYAAANAWLDRIDHAADILAVQLRRASLLARQGQLDRARQLLRQPPARSDAEWRRQVLAEAQLLRDLGRYDLVFVVYGEATERFPDDADLAYEQAMAAEKAGRPDEMERLLRALIARQPDYHHAYNALGYALADRNQRLPEAKALIQRAVALAPQDAYILDSLGWVEFRLGNHTEALRILRDAHQRRPDAEIAAHLGEVHWVLQQRDAALTVWREGLQLNPDNPTLQETLRRLQVQP